MEPFGLEVRRRNESAIKKTNRSGIIPEGMGFSSDSRAQREMIHDVCDRHPRRSVSLRTAVKRSRHGYLLSDRSKENPRSVSQNAIVEMSVAIFIIFKRRKNYIIALRLLELYMLLPALALLL